ncbi:MAG: HAD-IA family hydrolase [Bacteroidia bacterium]|nr:HAD-IA family hydrolase [Bacteroidia bacterium]
MKKSLLIFDFDGTIADTPAVALTIYNELSGGFGLPQTDHDSLMDLKDKRISELMRMTGMSWFKLPQFIRQARKAFTKHLHQVSPIEGMPETLHSLRERGYRMGILTSNSRSNVEAFLNRNDLAVFEFVKAPSSLWGKARAIRRLLRAERLERSEVVMIGDELRDIEAANKARVDAIGVTWGFNTGELLAQGQPARIVHTPADLLALLA